MVCWESACPCADAGPNVPTGTIVFESVMRSIVVIDQLT